MPAVDKLLLEEALQDSPQVPPAAPVPRCPRAEAEKAPPTPGWRWGGFLGGQKEVGLALRPEPGMPQDVGIPQAELGNPGESLQPDPLCHDPFLNSAETEAACLNFGPATY